MGFGPIRRYFIFLSLSLTCCLSAMSFFYIKPSPRFIFFYTGSHLLSRAVSSKVPSADWVLTVVFGMGTGVSLKRIATSKFISISAVTCFL